MGPDVAIIVVGLLVPLVCGAISSAIAKRKNRSVGGFFALGFFLGIIGVAISLVVSNGAPPRPQGTSAVVCARCNASQNVPTASTQFECWQCHQIGTVASARPSTRPRTEEQNVRLLVNASVVVSILGLLLLAMSIPWFLNSSKGVPLSIWAPPIAVAVIGLALGLAALLRGTQLTNHDSWMARTGIFIGTLPMLLTLVFALAS